jgi:hypothetical protein
MDQKIFRVVIHLRAESQLDASMLLSSVLADERCEAVEVVEVKDGKIASVFDAVAGQEEAPQDPGFQGKKGDLVVFYNDKDSVICQVVFKQGEATYGITPIVDDDELHTNCIYRVHASQLKKV